MDNGWNPNDEPTVFDKITMRHVVIFLIFWFVVLVAGLIYSL